MAIPEGAEAEHGLMTALPAARGTKAFVEGSASLRLPRMAVKIPVGWECCWLAWLNSSCVCRIRSSFI